MPDWRPAPAIEWLTLAEATLDIDGTIVRAKSAAPSMSEAVDDLKSGLRRPLVQLQDRTRSRSGRSFAASPSRARR